MTRFVCCAMAIFFSVHAGAVQHSRRYVDCVATLDKLKASEATLQLWRNPLLRQRSNLSDNERDLFVEFQAQPHFGTKILGEELYNSFRQADALIPTRDVESALAMVALKSRQDSSLKDMAAAVREMMDDIEIESHTHSKRTGLSESFAALSWGEALMLYQYFEPVAVKRELVATPQTSFDAVYRADRIPQAFLRYLKWSLDDGVKSRQELMGNIWLFEHFDIAWPTARKLIADLRQGLSFHIPPDPAKSARSQYFLLMGILKRGNVPPSRAVEFCRDFVKTEEIPSLDHLIFRLGRMLPPVTVVEARVLNLDFPQNYASEINALR